MTLTNILGIGILGAIGIYLAAQSFTFLKDLWFYRRANWDLSLDSGNKMLFLDMIRNSGSFKSSPIGRIRLTIGYQHSFMAMVLLGVVLFYQLR